METIRDYWPLIVAALTFALNYGILRGTLAAFAREVEQLREAAKPIVEIRERLVRVETEVAALVERTVPAIKAELEHQHDAHKAALVALRNELRDEFYRGATLPPDRR